MLFFRYFFTLYIVAVGGRLFQFAVPFLILIKGDEVNQGSRLDLK